MNERDMNTWQEIVSEIVYGQQLVNPKRIAFRLHRHSNYLSDICRRERVDPFAVCNAILLEAEKRAATDTPRYLSICQPILALLMDNTRWAGMYMDPALEAGMSYNKLCEHTGILCETLGGTIKALARIEADGKYDERDDAHIDACTHKIGVLTQRLHAILIELRRRRAVRSPA